tara:strand:- start:30345 stop:31394 length:1050 start_codon:yes stop_codon:yes gene_type:complete
MKKFIKFIKYLGIGGFTIFTIFTVCGLIIKNKGQSDINRENLLNEGAKLALDQNGRKIEYFTYGTLDTNAPVVINIHGSGLDATFEKLVHQNSCNELNLKGISISLPGYGNTDLKIGRSVVDWASEDLNAVLNLENVNKFMITGHSQGTPHAMAAALYFKERCIGMGLNAPLLSSDLTEEIKIKSALGYDQLKTTEELENPLNAWWFFTIYLATDLFSPTIPLNALIYTDEKIEEDTALVKMVSYSIERSVVRGSVGSAWETAKDVCYDWGFDPREIETKNICVWHASDDDLCPPEIGEWLSNHFKKKGGNVNFKNDNIGYGHMTYCNSYYQKTENSLVKALLDMHLKN